VLSVELVHAVQPVIAVVHESACLPLPFLEAVKSTEIVAQLMREGLPILPIILGDACVVTILVTDSITIHVITDPCQASELKALALAACDHVHSSLEW